MNIDRNGKPTLLAQDRKALEASATILRTLSALATSAGDTTTGARHKATADQIQAAVVDYSPCAGKERNA